MPKLTSMCHVDLVITKEVHPMYTTLSTTDKPKPTPPLPPLPLTPRVLQRVQHSLSCFSTVELML